MTRTGKIARLQRSVREELNRRLRDGEQGKSLVGWLNGLPSVKEALKEQFNSRPISEQNLSEWKQGGYTEWLAHQDALERAQNLSADAAELSATGGALGEHLAIALTARYAALLAQWDGDSNGAIAQNVRTLRALCTDIVELRRGDHSAARLKVEQERLQLERAKDEQHIQERFEKWLQQPEVKNRICGSKLTPEERQKRLRQIFNLAPERPVPSRGITKETLAEIERAAKSL
jgi:hypothetical protein